MSCKNYNSSVKSVSNVKKNIFCNVTAFNIIHYSITIDGKTSTFSQSASASASNSLLHEALQTAANLARGLTRKMLVEHVNSYGIPYGATFSSKNKNKNTNSTMYPLHKHSDTTTYTVNSNDPGVSADSSGYNCGGTNGCICSADCTQNCFWNCCHNGCISCQTGRDTCGYTTSQPC